MPLSLSLKTIPTVPLEAETINPDQFKGLDSNKIKQLTVMHGNEQASIGDFFDVSGESDAEIHLAGDLSRIKHLGCGMKSGKLVIDGNVGQHLGAGMSGGEIIVNGNAGDWVGPEMSGGRITITGNAGHLIGSAYRGSPIGMLGGEIIIHGDAKNEVGHAMRRGLIVIGGNSGDFTGVNILSGTIIVLGKMGIRTGAGMKRGSIISLNDAEMLPTFSYACQYHPTFIRSYLVYLKTQQLNIEDKHINGLYQRWSGDAVELNRGEVLLYSGS